MLYRKHVTFKLKTLMYSSHLAYFTKLWKNSTEFLYAIFIVYELDKNDTFTMVFIVALINH